jgi:TRAP-type transport system small permease protein
MKEKAANVTEGKPPTMALGRFAAKYNKVLSPISTYAAYIGATVLGILVLTLIYSILSRRLFAVPLKGTMELTEIGLGLITFFMLAYDSLHGESMVVDIVIDRFPRKSKAIIGVIIHLLSVAMLAVLTWQLLVQGIKLFGYHQTSSILRIPSYPFLYVAAFGTFLLTLVYFKHFLYSLDKAWRK